MFLLFGFGTKRQNLGAGQIRNCPRCNNTTQWARIRESQQFTLFFVPVARWNRRELEQCGICGAAVQI
ncbi:zinc-ribbon domain-containing protein [Rhodococcus zopfii]|uniref:Zinc-ribbon domain-containing protein n=1 Tax=Rhodococcus zopfii TaxID=43772 RepID=A0ABU3WNX8_9NOCA|nr:zinc-ribbon domain-containing protein [Rhodococcus zopfii]